MSDYTFLIFKCVNPDCGKAIKMKRPAVTGVYAVTCPHCRVSKKFNLKGLDAFADEETTQLAPPVAGNAEDETEVVNANPQLPPQPIVDKSAGLMRGKLVMVRKSWLNKSFRLTPGNYIIGREDADEPSDISIKGDVNASRRSVQIAVSLGIGGYNYVLSVLKTTNPVTVNNTIVPVGEKVTLAFGDTIVVGKTHFRLEKDK